MEIIPILFYPILATIIAAVLATVSSILAVKFASKKVAQVVKIVSAVIVLLGIIACIVCMSLYYVNDVEPSGYYEDVNSIAMIIIAIVLIAILAVIYFLIGKKHPENDDTRTMAFGAIALALSFALSYAKIIALPQGGLVTFASVLPLMVYSYLFGIRRGIMLSAIYGVLAAIVDPYIIHPVQFLLDYPIAFAFIGLAGLFREVGLFKKIPIVSLLLGGIIAVLGRYFSHVASGIFAFASYVGEGYTVVAWGFLYNTFAFVDMAIALGAGCILFASRTFVTQILEKAPLSRRRGAVDIEADENDDIPENEPVEESEGNIVEDENRTTEN